MGITFLLIRGVLRSSNHTKTGPSEEGNSCVHRYELQRWTTGVRRAVNTLSPAGRWELQRGWGSCGVTKGLAESCILPGDAERGRRKVLPAPLLLPGWARRSPHTGRRWGQRWAGRGEMQLSPPGAAGSTSPGSARETPRGTRRFSAAPGQAPHPAARGLLPASHRPLRANLPIQRGKEAAPPAALLTQKRDPQNVSIASSVALSLSQAHAGHQRGEWGSCLPPGRDGGGRSGPGAPRSAFPAGGGRRQRPGALAPRAGRCRAGPRGLDEVPSGCEVLARRSKVSAQPG